MIRKWVDVTKLHLEFTCLAILIYTLNILCLCLSRCFLVSVEFTRTGVECFFDNRRLAAWADILFLCCLPSHLPKVCADLHSHLSKCCLVYSFTSAVPVTRYHRAHSTLWFSWFSVTEVLYFHPLFQISTATWTRLCSQTTVWLCGLWHCRCVAVLHSSDRSFDGSFADRGIVSSYNQRYVMFHYCRLQLLSQSLHVSCYVRCKGKHLKFVAVDLTLYLWIKPYSCIFRWCFSGSDLGVCGVVQPPEYLHLCWSGIQWCSLSDQQPA